VLNWSKKRWRFWFGNAETKKQTWDVSQSVISEVSSTVRADRDFDRLRRDEKVSEQTKETSLLLRLFYAKHGNSEIKDIHSMTTHYADRRGLLNDLLQSKYGENLTDVLSGTFARRVVTVIRHTVPEQHVVVPETPPTSPRDETDDDWLHMSTERSLTDILMRFHGDAVNNFQFRRHLNVIVWIQLRGNIFSHLISKDVKKAHGSGRVDDPTPMVEGRFYVGKFHRFPR